MKINLLPLARQRQPFPYRAILIAVVCVLCVAAPVTAYSYRLLQNVQSLRNEVAGLKARSDALGTLEPLLLEYARLEQELRRVRGEAVPENVKLVPFLDELARLLPDRVFVTDLSIDETGMRLSGVTPSYALAAEFLRVLAGSDLFAEPVLSVLQADDLGHRFELTVEIRAGEQ
ncbi:MAG: PilN domain-containing protein [Selenomonadales bacterium]|nr:PilN domain-containing protein [Selenomonadales bacterium]